MVEILTLDKIYIANRGEIAARAARTFVEMGIAGVVPDTDNDLNYLARRIALDHLDEGWEIGHLGGFRQEQNFLNVKRLVTDAQIHECNGAFLGYGYGSEKPEYVQAFLDVGIEPLAGPVDAMRLAENKISARESMAKTRYRRFHTIPVVPGTGHLKDFDEVLKAARDLGFPHYPVMGIDPKLGGGKGHGKARNERELREVYESITGKPSNEQFCLQRLIQNPLHVEIQIAGDKYGHIVALGERDCTMQYEHQKVIEEAPSPNISRRLARTLQRAAVAHAKAIGYYGVGTWEFILDKDKLDSNGDPEFYGMEINPRIQVEHTVTEESTRIQDAKTGELKRLDVVSLMVDIAAGRPLPFAQKDIRVVNHSMQARVYAKNPDRNMEDAPGKVDYLRFPKIDGVRIDSAIGEGVALTGWSDLTAYKLIGSASERDEAIRLVIKGLSETEVGGLTTDASNRLAILKSHEFATGDGANVNFVEELIRREFRERARSIDSFIGSHGTYTPISSFLVFEPKLMLQDPVVIKAEVDPATGKKADRRLSYSEHLVKLKEAGGKESVATVGIVQRDGIRFVLYHLGGALGVQEGNVFDKACQVASDERLVLVSVLTNTPGADQWQDNLALHQMSRTVTALNKYKPRQHFVVFSGGVYGGVPASFAGQGIKISVNSPDSKTGFSGPRLVAEDMGKTPEKPGAAAAYALLPPGTHTPLKHYEDRNHHILVHSLGEAGNVVTNFIHTLPLPESIVDPNKVYDPEQMIGLVASGETAERFDRPGMRLPVLIGRFKNALERYKSQGEVVYPEPLTINQRMEILLKASRPTTAEILDPNFGVVDRTALLASPPFQLEDLEQYPPIIAGAVKIEGHDLFIIGQQTQRLKEDGVWVKKYAPQKPADWRYVEEIVKLIPLRRRIPILLLVDTNGADCGVDSEAQNQSTKISDMINLFTEYPYGVLTGLIGFKGSGGGETFNAPYDFSFAAANSLSSVAAFMASYWMLTNKWISNKATDEEKAELAWYIGQQKDSTAEGRIKLKLTDVSITEGSGGAHLHPQLYARNLRKTILDGLTIVNRMKADELMERRYRRSEAPNLLVSVPR